MKRFLSLTVLTLLGQLSVANASALSEQKLGQILSHPDRPTADSKRDAARLPAKIMAFSGVAADDHVLDLFAGGGWYSELFSRAVGKNGKVYVQNDEVIWRFAEEGLKARTKDARLSNLTRFDGVAIADMTIPDNSVDIAFMALNYHDLFFTDTVRDGKTQQLRDEVVDYKSALAAVKKAMKDGAVFIIIDHFAKPGSGYAAANTLHRIDPDIIRFQMDDMGFKLVEEAFYLRNPEDDLGKTVFDTSVRGKTDRFIYKFAKK
jgi:predicted methyltransferase